MFTINGKKYKWNDNLQQYELVEFGRHKKDLKMEKIKYYNEVHVQAKPIDGCSASLFFNSITEASKRFGVVASTIFSYMKNGKSYKGYTFERVEEMPISALVKRKNIGGMGIKSGIHKPRPVVLKHKKYGTLFEFPSFNECARKLGVHSCDVSNSIRNGKPINDFIVEEKIDCMKSVTSMNNDLENMMNIISALKRGDKVYYKKKSGGDWELVKCGACDFINYDYKIGCKMSNIVIAIEIDEISKNKLNKLAKNKGVSINSLFKDKLKNIVINELNMCKELE